MQDFIQQHPAGVNSLLTVEEAMQQLAVSRATIYRLINTGRLRTVKISRGARRVSARAIQDFIRELEAESARSSKLAS